MIAATAEAARSRAEGALLQQARSGCCQAAAAGMRVTAGACSKRRYAGGSVDVCCKRQRRDDGKRVATLLLITAEGAALRVAATASMRADPIRKRDKDCAQKAQRVVAAAAASMARE